MNGYLLTALIIVAIIIWLRIDFIMGLRTQRKGAERHTQHIRDGEITLLSTGDDFFRYAINDIRQAKKHVHIIFYIFRTDFIGRQVLTLLEQKAKEGVSVRLLVDRFGCKIPRKKRKQLKKAGVHFAYSHPVSFPWVFFTLNRRNHRKISICDGHIGYIGGYNVGDEYLGRNPKFGVWRDFHLRLSGDGVQDLQEQFLEDWQTAKQSCVFEEGFYPTLRKGPHPLRILPTDGVYLKETFIDLIKQAKETIIIGTPYYIPGEELQRELIQAAKRGIDIKLVLPKKSDHPLVREAAFPYFQALLESGIEVYQFYRGFFHAKCIIIDNQMCDVGTANFDKRSFYINHEINCLVYDKDFVKQVRTEMEHDIAISERLTLENYQKRPFSQKSKEKLATWVSGLL